MKKLLAILILLTTSVNVLGQRYSRNIEEANELYRSKKFSAASKKYKRAFNAYSENFIDLYNGARTSSLAGDTLSAIKYLSMAFSNGYTNIDRVQSDPDLKALHGTDRWLATLETGRKIIQANREKFRKVGAALSRIYKEDQRLRLEYNSILERHPDMPNKTDSILEVMRVTDSIHVAFVTNSIDTFGWLGQNRIGIEANLAQFYVIQHSNLAVRRKYLPVLEKAVKKGTAEKIHLAYLIDRIAVEEGRLQIYGSQFGENPQTRKLYVLPLLKPGSVDERRRQAFMPPIADELRNMGIKWDVEEYKKELSHLKRWEKRQNRLTLHSCLKKS